MSVRRSNVWYPRDICWVAGNKLLITSERPTLALGSSGSKSPLIVLPLQSPGRAIFCKSPVSFRIDCSHANKLSKTFLATPVHFHSLLPWSTNPISQNKPIITVPRPQTFTSELPFPSSLPGSWEHPTHWFQPVQLSCVASTVWISNRLGRLYEILDEAEDVVEDTSTVKADAYYLWCWRHS